MKEKRASAKSGIFDKLIDKSVDFIFSNDSRKWILLVFILGFALRAIISLRAGVGADEMVYGPSSFGFLESGKLQTVYGAPLWNLMMDVATKIFGTGLFGFRFLSVFLGSLTIILVYLLGKELFNEKIGLIASFIFAISPFQADQMVALMDIPMTFFVFLSIYAIILFFKTSKRRYFILSWSILGLAILVKQIALIFILVLVLFSLYYNKKYKNKWNLKQIFYAALIIIIILLPTLAYNYLLFKDKGILDIQFTRFAMNLIDLPTEQYGDISGGMQPFTLAKALLPREDLGMPGFFYAFLFFWRGEIWLLLLLSLIGFYFLFKNQTKFKWLFVLSFLFPFIFLSGTSLLNNHFVFGSTFIALLSALSISELSKKFHSPKTTRLFIYSVLAVILILSMVKIYADNSGFFGKHEIGQLADYKRSSIPENSLVVADSRIYRGRIVFMLHDRLYLESGYFADFVNNQEKISGEPINLHTYFIEAATDDSGWGTIKNQPDFNQSMEQIVDFFKSNSKLVRTISSTDGNPHFNVYETNLLLNPAILNYAYSTHQHFYYPVGYEPVNQNFDYYETYNVIDLLIDKLAHAILFLELLCAGLLIFFFVYFFCKRGEIAA